jgi:NAD-dependent deacetylase
MADAAAGKPEVAKLAGLIAAARRIAVLTGAGISTESGIPDFRSPGGIWSRMKPITYQEFVASEEARLEDWRRRFVMNAEFARAAPNAGHRAMTLLHEEGRLAGLITQNIDGLHQRAGFPPEDLIEIHGNATRGRCLDCRKEMTLEAVRAATDSSGRSPRCGCGGLVKAAVVSFGESMPQADMKRAAEIAADSDLFLVIGSSLLVQPAASLPVIAAGSGARLAIVNRDPTPLDSHANLLVRDMIGTCFTEIYPQLAKHTGTGTE